MSFARYPKYKDSGVEWLGEVPEQWRSAPIKRVGRLQGGAGFPHEYQGVEGAELPFHKVNAIGQADREGILGPGSNTVSRETAKDLGAFVFPPSSIVFAKVGAALLLGRIRRVDRDCCIDNNMMGLVVGGEGFDHRYIAYAMTLVRFDLIANPGTVPSLNEGQIGDFCLPIPSISEQEDISAFLDRETAKIDALVGEQQRLIELLKEKRQAVLSHAVTKGLNRAAAMKPSGIEWLGDVPAHWEVRRLKNVLKEPLKYGANEPAELDDRAFPRFIRITDIDDFGGLKDETFKSLPVEVAQPFLLEDGDVLLARSGATVGKSFIYSAQWGIACFAGYLIRARLQTTACLPMWLYYYCQTNEYWDYVVGTQIQSTIQNVSAEKYSNLNLPLPPRAEQTTIVAFLDVETAKLDTLIAEAQRAIDLLQERRTALISAAVTGQIDVRNLV
ncbi:MAG TPA: restriction endonuclease subunit S [Myxococcota bacterium]|nr:restriction endonuclease subunit S [Myxococcota bacterium]